MHQFLQSLHGRTVAIVGNGPVDANVSEEVDASDVVIRFNHMYRIRSGMTGIKTTHVIQTFTTAWDRAPDKAVDILQSQHARIWIGKKPEQYGIEAHRALGRTQFVGNLSHLLSPWANFTTGGAFLCWLANEQPQAKFKVYGFPGGPAWEEYLRTDAKHYREVAAAERQAVDKAIASLEACVQASEPYKVKPPEIVIPCKRVSTGAPGKNRKLIGRCLDKMAGRSVTVVTDDPEMPAIVGDRAKVYMCAAIPPMADVTETLRQWAAFTGFDGEVALVQCTSPGLTLEWVDTCLKQLEIAPVVVTAAPFEYKPTALLVLDVCGAWHHAMPQLGQPSRPRQTLPTTIRINGGVTAFHADALAFGSLFDAGRTEPVIVPAEDSLDVDTEEQLEQALMEAKE